MPATPPMSPFEARIDAALETICEVGDVAPADHGSPEAFTIRHHVSMRGLAVYDPDHARYVLTRSGRERLSRRGRAPATVTTLVPRLRPREVA